MKIASISTTKNESDIIEAFVRHNARFVDAFFFIDESVDATRTILGRLQAEGFDITVLDSTSTVYEQRMLITSALRIVDGLNAFDWVVLLDADEILPDVPRPQFEQVLAGVGPTMLASMPWQTFVPTSRDYHRFNDPLVENFLPRNTEGPQGPIPKIAVPRALFGVAVIDPGNHGAQHGGQGGILPAQGVPLRLGHFPVRSTDQIVVKNIVAAHVTSMKESKTQLEGWHVYASLDQMRANNFDMPYEELLRTALTYAIADAPPGLGIDRQAAPIRARPLEMKYRDLRYRSPLAALDREMEAMARLVVQHRRATTHSRQALRDAQARLGEALATLDGTQSKSA